MVGGDVFEVLLDISNNLGRSYRPGDNGGLACREGLTSKRPRVFHQFMIASDCANVISSIRGQAMGRHGHVVQEIKARSAEFEKVEFLHEERKQGQYLRTSTS